MPVGQPTKYDPALIVLAREYIASCGRPATEIPTIEGLAILWKVHRATIYEWEKLYPEVADIMEEIKMHQKNQLMNDGLYGGKEINPTMAIFLLKVNHDMIEKTQTDITSLGQKLEAPRIILDTKESNE